MGHPNLKLVLTYEAIQENIKIFSDVHGIMSVKIVIGDEIFRPIKFTDYLFKRITHQAKQLP